MAMERPDGVATRQGRPPGMKRFLRTKRAGFVTALLVMGALFALFAGRATAVHGSGSMLELDANANVVDDSAPGAPWDWASIFDTGGNQILNDSQLKKSDFVQDYATPDATYFATSAKDIDTVGSWQRSEERRV